MTRKFIYFACMSRIFVRIVLRPFFLCCYFLFERIWCFFHISLCYSCPLVPFSLVTTILLSCHYSCHYHHHHHCFVVVCVWRFPFISLVFEIFFRFAPVHFKFPEKNMDSLLQLSLLFQKHSCFYQ